MRRLYLFFLTAFLVLMSLYLWSHQSVNWDIEAYMGLVLKAENPGISPEELHEKVYSDLRSLNPDLFDFESHPKPNQDEYYKILSENPTMYAEEIQLFAVKPLYNFINFLLYRLGVKLAVALFLTNISSYCMLLLLVYFRLSNIFKNHGFSLIITVFVGLFRPVLDAARQPTPDMLGTFLFLLSLYLLVFRRNIWAFTVCAVCAIFTRPEFIIPFSVVFVIILSLYRNHFEFKYQVLSLLYIVSAFVLIQCFNHVSWQTLVSNQFIKFQYFPVSAPVPMDFSKYVGYVKSNIILEFNNSLFALLLFICIIVFGKDFKFKNVSNPQFSIYYLAILADYCSIFVRFLMFPSFVSRMMCPFYLVIIFTLMLYLYRETLSIRNFVFLSSEND